MKTEILRMLRESNDYISGQMLCDKFGVSRTAVWKAINSLKDAGYEIEAVQNKGYHLISTPDVMDKIELESLRKTRWAGCEIFYYDSTDSTNNRAKELADAGHPHGTFCVSDRQTAGKGRRGRSWESPSGTGIFMSLVLKPDMNPNNASMLTLVSAMAVSRAIESVTGLNNGIKWPNDIVVNGKKVVGILTEMSAQFDYINNIVVGIGINVHNESFPEEISHMATSLMIECGGKHFHRSEIIEKFLEYFETYYDKFMETEDMSALVTEYNSMMVNLHQKVRVLDPKDPYEGKAMGISKRGELIVDTWSSRKLVSSGEVSVRGIYGYV